MKPIIIDTFEVELDSAKARIILPNPSKINNGPEIFNKNEDFDLGVSSSELIL